MVVLTSLVMKPFEMLVRQKSLEMVEEDLKTPHAVCVQGTDAAGHLNHTAHHFYIWNVYLRLKIKSRMLARKLLISFNADVNLAGWIVDFVTCRSQSMRINGFQSIKLLRRLSSGTCPVPSAVYILYTTDCRI